MDRGPYTNGHILCCLTCEPRDSLLRVERAEGRVYGFRYVGPYGAPTMKCPSGNGHYLVRHLLLVCAAHSSKRLLVLLLHPHHETLRIRTLGLVRGLAEKDGAI